METIDFPLRVTDQATQSRRRHTHTTARSGSRA